MNREPMTTLAIITILLIGLSAGILSGLIGIGGGVLMVPALVFFLSYNQHQAQGTSLAVLTLPVTLLGALIYYQECRKMGNPIDLRVVGLLAATFVFGAFLGSKVAVRIDKELLKKIFAIVLIYSAVKLLNWDMWLIKWIKSL